MSRIIMLPGIGGSGEDHWQSRWERADSRVVRFRPADWDAPDPADWIAALEREVVAAPRPPLLVAHSLACLLVAHWQRMSDAAVAGAFLVAVPDPRSAAFPSEAARFAGAPDEPFRFPSLIVASGDDPFGTVAHARGRAARWGSGLVELGRLGHINARSGLGDWPEGAALLRAFAAGAGFRWG